MMASAMHLAWGLWQLAIIGQPWTINLSASMFVFVMFSWYLTAIVGSVVGAILVNIWKKTIIYVSAKQVSKLGSQIILISYR